MFDVAIQAAIGCADHRPRDRQGAAQGRAREVLRRRHHAQAEAAREAEEGQEADEAGRRRRGAAGGVPRSAQSRRAVEVERARTSTSTCRSARTAAATATSSPSRVTTGEHGSYVDALLTELELERDLLAADVETVFVGGGTPTFTEPAALARLLAALPAASEMTVEANPETVTPELASLLREHGVDRVSLGAQSFQPHLLEVLERRARPEDVRGAVRSLRDAGFDNISLDLIYGIPGQSVADLERDLAEALALAPDHLSCYELEAKPGTRFTHAHGDELDRQADAMEDYFERVVETLDGGRLPLVRDRELLPRRSDARPSRAAQPGLLARARLPRRRRRGGLDGRRPPLAERAEPAPLPRVAAARRATAARARGARARDGGAASA